MKKRYRAADTCCLLVREALRGWQTLATGSAGRQRVAPRQTSRKDTTRPVDYRSRRQPVELSFREAIRGDLRSRRGARMLFLADRSNDASRPATRSRSHVIRQARLDPTVTGPPQPHARPRQLKNAIRIRRRCQCRSRTTFMRDEKRSVSARRASRRSCSAAAGVNSNRPRARRRQRSRRLLSSRMTLRQARSRRARSEHRGAGAPLPGTPFNLATSTPRARGE
jgi:hypothetical protein